MKFILLVDRRDNVVDVGFENHTGHDDFVQDVVDTIRMEDQIQLTYILKAFVKSFNKNLNQI